MTTKSTEIREMIEALRLRQSPHRPAQLRSPITNMDVLDVCDALNRRMDEMEAGQKPVQPKQRLAEIQIADK